MLVLLLVLRVVHIFGGIFWGGSSFLLTEFIEPTIRKSGDDGRKFMQRFAATSGFTRAILITATATVVAGLWLFWIVSDGLDQTWLVTGRGIGLTIGMFAGLAAYLVGYLMQNRSIQSMVRIGAEVAAGGGPPSPEQGAEMARLQATIRRGGRIVSILLLLAIVMMATARYLPTP